MRFKMSSGKCQPFCFGLNVLTQTSPEGSRLNLNSSDILSGVNTRASTYKNALDPVWCRYNVVQYTMILHTSLHRLGTIHTRLFEPTEGNPIASPNRRAIGVLFVRAWEKMTVL